MGVEIIHGRKTGITHSGHTAPLLMLHCALAHRGALLTLASHLPERAVIAVDLPGHGETEFDTSRDIQAQAIETAIFLLEKAGPSDIFGHSFGATVALKLAMQRPDLVRGLYLYEPVYFSVLAKANPEAYATEAKAAAGFTQAASARDWPEAARAFLARWSVERFDALPARQQAYILKTIPLITASEASIVVPPSGEALLCELAKAELPILLMEGTQSPPVISAINTVLATTQKRIKREIIANAGHMGPLTHPESVAKLMVLA